MTGAELREARERLGLSQEEFGARLGARANTISRWERSDLNIPHGKMLRLALKALGDERGR